MDKSTVEIYINRESDEDSEDSGDEREGDEQEVALSEAAILRRMA